MRTSKIGIDLIKHFEGLHDGDLTTIGLQPKMDPIGIWTEGYGRAMRDAKGEFIKGIANKKLAYSRQTIKTEPEAVLALAQDLKVYENIVIRKVTVDLKQREFNALVSHTYNTGGSNTLFQLINRKSTPTIIKSWFTSKYISAGGVPLAGLVNRRKAEAKLYFHE